MTWARHAVGGMPFRAPLPFATAIAAQHLTYARLGTRRKERPPPGILGGLLHDRANLSGNLGQPDLQAVALDRPDEGRGVLAVQRGRPSVVLQQPHTSAPLSKP